ncbi:MAG TPA: hypothetical protein VG435_09825 [Acidimicrobiales bacterium]|jgi:hypothetical protein|nr:hypothetical protein [Acidimicrobiales bacterium]
MEQDHPVFTGRAGGSRLRVWALLSREANTSRATDGKPLGHVRGGERRIAEALGLTDKTVRGHLHELLRAELLVVWRQPVRGQSRALGHNRWAGWDTEYLVVPLACPTVVAEVDSENKAPAATGRPLPVGKGGPLPVATGRPLPVGTGSDLGKHASLDLCVRDLYLRDLCKDQGADAEASTREGSRDGEDNRAAYVALSAEERRQAGGQFMTAGERAGLANVLMRSGEDVDANAARLVASMLRTNSEPKAAAEAVLGTTPTEYAEMAYRKAPT